jgi:hypothetical protein
VLQNETEKVIFASADIHKYILEAGLKKDDTFELRKAAVQNGKKVTASVEFSVAGKKNGTTPHNHGIPFDIQGDGFKELMRRYVQEALDIVKEVNTIPWQNEEIRAISLTCLSSEFRDTLLCPNPKAQTPAAKSQATPIKMIVKGLDYEVRFEGDEVVELMVK